MVGLEALGPTVTTSCQNVVAYKMWMHQSIATLQPDDFVMPEIAVNTCFNYSHPTNMISGLQAGFGESEILMRICICDTD